MRPGNDDIIGVTSLGLRDHVPARRGDGFGVQRQRQFRCRGDGWSVFLTDAAGGDLRDVRVAEGGAVEWPRLVVDDNHRDRAEIGRDGLLGTERAHPAIDDDDGTGDVETVVIRCFTARRIVRRRCQDTCGETGVRGGRRVRERRHRHVLLVDGQRLGLDRELVELELGGLHLESRSFELAPQVVDAGVVTGRARSSVAVVCGRDCLELFEMGHHRVLGDRIGQAGAVCDRDRGRNGNGRLLLSPGFFRGRGATGQNESTDCETCDQGHPRLGNWRHGCTLTAVQLTRRGDW